MKFWAHDFYAAVAPVPRAGAMKFWGEEVKPGMTVYCKIVDGFMLNVSQTALGETQNRTENVIVSVKAAGAEKVIIGTLSADVHPQFMCNYIFNKDIELSHSSNATSVFFSGYMSAAPDISGSDSGQNEDAELETDKIPVKENIIGPFSSTVDRRQHANSMVVKMLCSIPSPTEKDPDNSSFSWATGIVLVAESRFCYIMFKCGFIEKAELISIRLPDASTFIISRSRLAMPPKCSDRGLLAGCFMYQTDVNYDLKKLKAVEFGGVVRRFDEVYLCDAATLTRMLTAGFVSYADNEELFHDCTPAPNSDLGAAIFSADGKFVGINIEVGDGSISRALTVFSTTRHLLKLYPNKKTIGQFLDEVKRIGEKGN